MFRALGLVLLLWAASAVAQEPPFDSGAQPAAPLPTFDPPEESTEPAPIPTAEDGQEPGYLGLVADDRGEHGQGVRVVEVVAGSPAAQAGLQPGDLIIGLNQAQIRTLADFSAILERGKPGETLTFGTLRNQEPTNVEVVLGQRPAPEARPFEQFGRITPQPAGATSAQPGGSPAGTMPTANPAAGRPLLGVRTEPLTEASRRALGLPITGGALVRQVIPDTPAARAGIPLDALIVAVGGRAVSTPDDLTREVAAAGPGARLVVAYLHGNQTQTREVVLGDATEQADATRTWKSNEEGPPVADPAAVPSGDRVAQLEQRIEQLEQFVRHLAEQQQKLLDQLAVPR